MLGADGDGRRGLVFTWDAVGAGWQLRQGMVLPRGTLLLVEMVAEQTEGSFQARCPAAPPAPDHGSLSRKFQMVGISKKKCIGMIHVFSGFQPEIFFLCCVSGSKQNFRFLHGFCSTLLALGSGRN